MSSKELYEYLDRKLISTYDIPLEDVVQIKTIVDGIIRAKDTEIATANRERDDIESAMRNLFDLRKLAKDQINTAVMDAAKGYLRRCSSGGMDAGDIGLVLGVFEDMARLSVFADIYVRAMKTELSRGNV